MRKFRIKQKKRKKDAQIFLKLNRKTGDRKAECILKRT